MKKLFKLAIVPILALTTIAGTASAEEETKVNYEEKLPYMFKDPNWEKYENGDSGAWPLPDAPPYSTGIYSMASHNFIDYKEDSNDFFDTASKYKSSGNTEVYYTSNPSTSVRMGLADPFTDNRLSFLKSALTKSTGGDTAVNFTYSNTAVKAYNNTSADNELVMDSSQGQWLVTNGIYSRDNLKSGITLNAGTKGTTISASSLSADPWGVMGTMEQIAPEDFLVGLSKAVYGVEQSRPIYMQTTPYRLAKKVTWSVTRTCPGGITWTYQTGDWLNQDVSHINPAWADLTPPACGETKIMDRGEYIVHPEGYLNNVWHRYHKDQNAFVSANVYELYFSKLLQKGILTTDGAFANVDLPDFKGDKEEANSFTFQKRFGEQFYKEYQEFGTDVGSSSKYKYPAWATELGALYSSPELTNIELGHNITDKSIMVTFSGAPNAHQRALGIKYNVTGNSTAGVTSISINPNYENQIMAKRTVTIIEALRIIERAMRVEDGDMSETEATIITKKYGAQYLDNLNDDDRKTVSYLLAKGVLNFENYQEYSNLYSPLSKSFAYKLIYRVANEDARMQFTEVTLTDSDDLPAKFSEYKQSIVKADLKKLTETDSITPTGKLVKNNTNQPLTLLSDINFKTKYSVIKGSATGEIGDRYVITADVDDPLKYLYRGMPMVLVQPNGQPYLDPIVSKTSPYLYVYRSSSAKIYNDVNDAEKRYVGIKEVKKNTDTGRYDVVFYAYGSDYDTAVTFIKANLQTRISNVSTKEEESTVISETNGALSSTKGSDLNSSISSNNDLIVNRDFDLTAYSNSKTSIVGNNLVPGASAVKVGDQALASLNVISKLTNTTAFEETGSKEIVSLDSSQLKGLNTLVQNSAGETVGKTTMIGQQVSSRPTTKGKNDVKQTVLAYNLSMLKSADTLMSDLDFKVTDPNDKDKEQTIKGTVVVSWQLDLPSEMEQNSLVGLNISPNVNDGAKSAWIFTKPSNKALLEVWNYNTGLNQAILKTFSGNNLSIKSGYFVPTIDVLIDSNSTTHVDAKGVSHPQDLTASQLQEIENQIAAKIGENLSASWVQTYIGSSTLANFVVNDQENESGVKAFNDNVDKNGYMNPPGLLRGLEIPDGKTVWSYLVFNQNKPNDEDSSYLDMHTHLARLNLHTIYTTINGNNYYGYFSAGSGEGMLPHLVLPFVKDNYDNVYKNTEFSDYTYDDKTRVLKQNMEEGSISTVGRTVKYKDKEWIVAADTPYTYKLYSTKYVTAVLKDGKIYESVNGKETNTDILTSIHGINTATFGTGQEKGINSAMYMKTEAFDFTPDPKTIATDKKFMAIRNGTLQPYVYTGMINKDGSTSLRLDETTLNDGEVVHVPAFVVLSKSTWSITSEGIEWSKKFLGADPNLYTSGSLVQGLKEQLLSENSKNLELSQDVKTGTLTIGKSTGAINGRNITFAVPYEAGMISGSKLNVQAVLDSFNQNADLTMTGNGKVSSAAQYLTDKKVGDYDPTYKDYHNTLVDNKGKLQVATGTKLVDYTPSTVVDSVSLTGMIMDGVRFLNYGGNSSSGIYKVYQYQDVTPPAVVAPFTNGAPPVVDADGAIIANTASTFEPLSTAMSLFESLQKQLHDIAVQNIWYLFIVIILGGALLMSLTTLLAHVFAHTPISNLFFERMYDITNVDFLALMSIGTVRITGDTPNSWVRTARTSIFLGVIPIVIFGIMKMNGWI